MTTAERIHRTTLAVHGGQAVAREVLWSLPRIFTEPQLRELVDHGVLGEQVLAHEVDWRPLAIKPQLATVANPPRRDARFNAVKTRSRDCLEVPN